MPVHDDWEACAIVLERLDEILGREGLSGTVLLVDDGSRVKPAEGFPGFEPRHLTSIQRLGLVRNLGHQRAICVALCHLSEAEVRDPIVVMDADGEDDPEDVPRLLREFAAHGGTQVVFAERLRRTESRLFKIGYWLYRTLHWFLTGYRVRVGNFSVISGRQLRTLAVSPALWSHYSAAVFTSGIPYGSIGAHRAERVAGRSKMNFVALAVHGLAAISVYSDIVGVRLFLLTVLAGAISALGLIVVVAIRFFSGLALPGWATYASGIFLILLGQSVMAAIGLSLLSLRGRLDAGALPIRDYRYFVEPVERLYEAG